MSLNNFLSLPAGSSPVVPANTDYVQLDESDPLVRAFLAFDPRSGSHQLLAADLRGRLDALEIVRPWGSESAETPAEEVVYAAREFVGGVEGGIATGELDKRRWLLEFAHSRYLEAEVLNRWGDYPEFTLHSYTTGNGTTLVAVYLYGQEEAEPVLTLPAHLNRPDVDTQLAVWYAGFLRGRRDGQADLFARAGAILSVVS